MKSQTSLVASKVRIQQWAAQIRECQNRPQDMDVSTWCEMNGITKACYYYRLKKVRQQCLEITGIDFPTFVELEPSAGESQSGESKIPEHPEIIASVHNSSGMIVELFSNISDEMIEKIIRVMSHAE